MLELARRKQCKVFWEIVVQPQTERDHVARGRDLGIVGQAVRVFERRRRHANLACALCHQVGELVFRARNVFGNRDGHIISRLGDQRLDSIDQCDLGAFLETKLGRWRAGCLVRYFDPCLIGQTPLLDQIEHDIERHHLGQGRRIARLIGVCRADHSTGIGIDDVGCMLATSGGCQCRGDQNTQARRQRDGRTPHVATCPLSCSKCRRCQCAALHDPAPLHRKAPNPNRLDHAPTHWAAPATVLGQTCGAAAHDCGGHWPD